MERLLLIVDAITGLGLHLARKDTVTARPGRAGIETRGDLQTACVDGIERDIRLHRRIDGGL